MNVHFTALLFHYEVAYYEMTLAQLRSDSSTECFALGRLTAYRELLEEYSPLDSAPTVGLIRGASEAAARKAQKEFQAKTGS